jgi:hypothetical protein
MESIWRLWRPAAIPPARAVYEKLDFKPLHLVRYYRKL